MKLSNNDRTIRKRTYCIMAVAFLVAYTVMCLVISPLLVTVSSDVAFDGTIVPTLLDYLGKLLELAAISVAYAVIIFGIFGFTHFGFRGGFWIFAGATLYKYTLNTIVDWVADGSVPWGWKWDVVNILFYTLLEMLQLMIVWAIVKGVARDRVKKFKGFVPAKEDEYPFSAFYDKENPFLRSAFLCALVVFLSKVFGRLINDLFSLVVFGLPEKGITWVLMGLSYILEALSGVLCYIVVVYVLSKLLEKSRLWVKTQ